MVVTEYRSTLLDEAFKSKKAAKAAEDKYIENHFNQLHIEADRKKRMRKMISNLR